ELNGFESLLEKTADSRSSADSSATLEEHRKRLNAAEKQVAATSVGQDPSSIADWLSTPLADAKRRSELSDKLNGSETGLDESAVRAVAKRITERPLSDFIGLMRDRADELDADTNPYDRALDHARLEAQLIRLADPATADDLSKLAKPVSTAAGPRKDAVR